MIKKQKRKKYYENNEERLWDQTPNKQTELSNKEKDKKEVWKKSIQEYVRKKIKTKRITKKLL